MGIPEVGIPEVDDLVEGNLAGGPVGGHHNPVAVVVLGTDSAVVVNA